MKNLIIDGNAIFYQYFFRHKTEKIEDIILLAQATALNKMQFLANKYKVDNTIIVFDCENDSWRKLYTSEKNPEKVTHKKYKDGRRETLTRKEREKLSAFDDSMQDFINFIRTQTSIICAQGKYLEGDDLIAGFVHMYPKSDHVIYSSDKDFMQLINSIEGEVTLVENQKDTERSLDDWDGNPELFLFEKCFRGEPRGGDNIQNAYPRIPRKKILSAFEDDFLKNNIFSHTFEVTDMNNNGEPVVYKYETRKIFKENQLLMDLTKQPLAIKELIEKAIDAAIEHQGRFDYMGFLRFCRKNGMELMIKEKDKFVRVLSKRFTDPGNRASLCRMESLPTDP